MAEVAIHKVIEYAWICSNCNFRNKCSFVLKPNDTVTCGVCGNVDSVVNSEANNEKV